LLALPHTLLRQHPLDASILHQPLLVEKRHGGLDGGGQLPAPDAWTRPREPLDKLLHRQRAGPVALPARLLHLGRLGLLGRWLLLLWRGRLLRGRLLRRASGGPGHARLWLGLLGR